MDLTSPQFWLFFLIAVVILVVRAKKKRVEFPQKPKGIGGKVYTLFALLSKETPLLCLLDDAKRFGVLFKDKEPPVLPHGPGCLCQVIETYGNSTELYTGSGAKDRSGETDLGPLSQTERRYYQARLVLRQRDCTTEVAEQSLILVQRLELADSFKIQIDQHLEGKQ